MRACRIAQVVLLTGIARQRNLHALRPLQQVEQLATHRLRQFLMPRRGEEIVGFMRIGLDVVQLVNVPDAVEMDIFILVLA